MTVLEYIYDHILYAELNTKSDYCQVCGFDGKESTVRLRGYGRFKPVDQFQIIAGNDFSTKVAVDAGYLAASDDNPKYGRILQSGLGAISNWSLGEEKNVNLKISNITDKI